MICRKNSLGYMDFMRGKMPLSNKSYILKMIDQMTRSEKDWFDKQSEIVLSGKAADYPFKEKIISLIHGIETKTGESYSLTSLIEESQTEWSEPEWGFPKGRRNLCESDYNCALREFYEETGYSTLHFHNICNIVPFEEEFLGSNYKRYKHKYFVMKVDYTDSLHPVNPFQSSEVSNMLWLTADACSSIIRPYNKEKIGIIADVHKCLISNEIVTCN